MKILLRNDNAKCRNNLSSLKNLISLAFLCENKLQFFGEKYETPYDYVLLPPALKMNLSRSDIIMAKLFIKVNCLIQFRINVLRYLRVYECLFLYSVIQWTSWYVTIKSMHGNWTKRLFLELTKKIIMKRCVVVKCSWTRCTTDDINMKTLQLLNVLEIITYS